MSEVKWRTVVLMEVRWGFAFFDVANEIFDMQPNMIWAHFTNPTPAEEAVQYLDLIKFHDKSAVWSGVGPVWSRDHPGPDPPLWSINGPDESFACWVKEYYSTAERFVVVDEKLRNLIESNLSIDCINVEEHVIGEVVWGIRFALPFLISEFEEKITISRKCPLPLCQGLVDLMKKYEIVIPTKAVDRDFVTYAGALQLIDERLWCPCTEMRKACAKLVPSISRMIKDNIRYVEVMAKTLTPWLVESDPHKWWTTAGEPWFTPDEMEKIKAEDDAADDAREKVDFQLARMIKNDLHDYRGYPESKEFFLGKLRSYEAKAKRWQKRRHTEMALEEAGEAAEGSKGEDGADVIGVRCGVGCLKEK